MKKNIQNSRLGILFAYGVAIELLCGLLICFAASRFGLFDQAIVVIRHFANAIAAFLGLFLTFVLGSWLVLFQFSDEFGAWLEWRGVRGLLSTAFLIHAFALIFAMGFIGASNLTDAPVILRLTGFFVVIGGLNILTAMFLVHQLVRLQSCFKLERKRIGK